MIGFDRQVTISIKNISILIQNVKTLYTFLKKKKKQGLPHTGIVHRTVYIRENISHFPGYIVCCRRCQRQHIYTICII